MPETGSILVLVEPHIHPQTVVARATWLAEINNCALHLLYCDVDTGSLSHGIFLSNEARDLARQIRSAQQELIGELAAEPRKRGLTVATDILEERPAAEALLRIAADLQPRYILKGTEYHSVAERSIFVDTDWQLIRSSDWPLWLVKPHQFRERPLTIAAVDPVHSHDKPAALDQQIIAAASEISEACGGELHLFHAFQSITGIGRKATRTFKPITLPVDELTAKIEAEHRTLLDSLATANDIDAEHTHLLPGNTTELLPAFARTQGSDLVVMGALARWGLRRMIIGSTAERVLDHLHCDILIVRLPDISAPPEAAAD